MVIILLTTIILAVFSVFMLVLTFFYTADSSKSVPKPSSNNG